LHQSSNDLAEPYLEESSLEETSGASLRRTESPPANRLSQGWQARPKPFRPPIESFSYPANLAIMANSGM
jgi:hypothetical protein